MCVCECECMSVCACVCGECECMSVILFVQVVEVKWEYVCVRASRCHSAFVLAHVCVGAHVCVIVCSRVIVHLRWCR